MQKEGLWAAYALAALSVGGLVYAKFQSEDSKITALKEEERKVEDSQLVLKTKYAYTEEQLRRHADMYSLYEKIIASAVLHPQSTYPNVFKPIHLGEDAKNMIRSSSRGKHNGVIKDHEVD